MSRIFLAGDIGGTKTVLGLFSEEAGPRYPLVEERFESDEFASLRDIVTTFLGRRPNVRPIQAAFGVAGPVHRGRVEVTNLPWVVDSRALVEDLGSIPVHLLNDLEAVANSIPTLEPADLELLKEGEAQSTGPIAVIAPGTGLGEAFLVWDGRRYRALPSEGGHTDFAPATPLELELLAYLQPRLGHVSYERVCSGIGIPNLYAFFRDTGRYSEPRWLRDQLAAAEDKTPIIVQTAQAEKADICVATLNLFVAILGSEAGNLVLQALTTGGVFLGGGIPPRILPQLRATPFLEAFTRKGRFSKLLQQVPVSVIVNSRAALYGAANHCLAIAQEEMVHD